MTEDEKIVSIVIVCMNRTDNLYPCLDSIRQFNSVGCEILVVAYLFNNQRLLEAQEKYPEVRFISSGQTRGFSEPKISPPRSAGPLRALFYRRTNTGSSRARPLIWRLSIRFFWCLCVPLRWGFPRPIKI